METKIDSKILEENVCILKNDLNEVNIILENITKSINKIPEMWKSTKEEEIMDSLKENSNRFSNISDANKKYIEFLDLLVRGEYESLDKKIDELKRDKIAIN